MIAIFVVALLSSTATAQQATSPAAQAPEPVRVIHAGTLISRPGSAPLRNATVIVRGARIAEVRSGFVEIPGSLAINLRNATVMPGLIDAHVHLVGLDDPVRERMDATERDFEDEAFTALGNAKRTLLAGFTTVRDLNGEPRLLSALRDGISRGELVGPTILMAARTVGVTSGHGSGVPGLNRDLTPLAVERASGMCDGPDACRRAVRLQIGSGADVIKIAASGGVLSNVAGGLAQQMTDEEMRAVVATAKTFGRKVAAHAHGVDGVNGALRAGVHSIEHGTFTNDETFRLYRQTGAYYVPTLLAPIYALRSGERGALTPPQLEKARLAAGNAEKSFARAIREKVRIAFGTDSGVSPHGRNAEEFELMVRNGMSPADAIKSATVDAAELLGRSERVGTIEAGKDADIVAVDGNPLENIKLLENVGFVMKHGRVHKLGGRRQITEAD